MKFMTSQELRQAFLAYFKSLKHEIVPSSSLVPSNDPTLLFTNAGMVQFKDTFLGIEQRPYLRAASVQRCVRAGGKHNDLENVGHTKRHHTFFEMVGNFSFGDYFKDDAIQFAWNFLTQKLKIPVERLWITVFAEDHESEEIWLNKIKINPQRFTRCGEKDNFWSMGDIGPCGPCTEIFYDHGPSIAGGPPGSPDHEGDRYVEVWNLVFMQYDRNLSGQLQPLPKPCVDTGMGLERIAAVMQGVHDNYAIDTFKYLLTALAQLTGYQDFQSPSMRVIVDHIRSTAFLIADGVVPSNEGRGYVLRRIIRRAVRHGYKLGQQQPFFYQLVPALTEVMGEAYPELIVARPLVEQVLQQEEEQFSHTLENGLKVFDEFVAKIKGTDNQIPGLAVFQLYDTYGFPFDLTADLARERGLSVDYVGFEEAMERQRQQSQQAHQFKLQQLHQLHILGETLFTGYENLTDEGKVTTLLYDSKPINILEEGQRGIVVLDRTPFYAESGGQVGDTGYLHFSNGCFRVEDTQKHGQSYLHYGYVIAGKLQVNNVVHALVDSTRHDIVLNHSATHLLHEALRRILGEHVVQKGSFVGADRLRFDFSHSKQLTQPQLQAVEHLVNQQIRANHLSAVQVNSIEDAKQKGALALFGEKYGAKVRIVSMGDFSLEICGGTHVNSTGEIGIFKIISQSPCAAGVRRIEALTGQKALEWIDGIEGQLQEVSNILKVDRTKITGKIEQILNDQRQLNKEIMYLKQKFALQQSQALLEQVVKINEGISVLAAEIVAVDQETLRKTLDQLKKQLGAAAIVLATVKDDKVQLVTGVTKEFLPYFNASELLNQVAFQINGRGGGRPDLAQGGGENSPALTVALASVPAWVKSKFRKI